jgi:hypothetical protein
MADIQRKFVDALHPQKKEIDIPISRALPCPYTGHGGRMFQDIKQLYHHVIYEDDHKDWEHYKELEEEHVQQILLKAALKSR